MERRAPKLATSKWWKEERHGVFVMQRWRERHPKAAAHLEPADVLVDRMRGSSSLWYRVRVNLQHVPAKSRPKQEALDPDGGPE